MRKELVLAIFAVLTLTLLTTDVTQAANPDLSVQPHLTQDETMKPLDPPLSSHPTAHQYTAPVTGPTYAYDNNQLTYSSTNISQQPYPSVYSRPTAYSGNATVTNPANAYDLNLNSFAALDIVKTKVGGDYFPYPREFNATTFNSTLVTTVSSVDIHIKYNVNLTEWGTARKVWYGFMLYVGTRKTELQPLTETQTNVTTRIGNWTAVPEPNDGVWSKADIGNIKIGIRTRPNMTQDVGTLRAFEIWARVYSPVVKYFDVRTFSPTAISAYSYLNVNVNCSILIGGCSYKVIVSVGSANTTLQNWSDVPQIEPEVLPWENVAEPNDGWWNQTDLSNLKVVIETQIIKSENDGEFRIYEAWITISPPTVNSYPGNHEGTATVSNPERAYDKNQMNYASISPAGTSTSTITYYFSVKSFNVTTLKEYATINIQMRFNVTTWNGRWGVSLLVGAKSVYLQKQIADNQTEPMLRTWVGVCEPNDGVWSPADLSSMLLRVEVRRALAGGTCTFREYEAWVTMPKDHFTVRAQVSDIQSAAPLYGWEANVTFNPAVLQAVVVNEGPFLKQAGLTQFSGYTMDNTAGWVHSGSTVDDWDSGGVYGSGVVATITFQVIAKGNSMLNLTRVFLVTFDGTVPVDIVGFTRTPGWFQYMAGDVNGDAIVNALDLYRVGRAYGKATGIPGYDIDADQDKDGNVDIDDLIVVRSHYGAT